jgi:hypothetical protein
MIRVHIYLPTANAADSIRFFVDQLKLFKVVKDLGMGNVLLQHTKATDFHLMLSPDDPVRLDLHCFRSQCLTVRRSLIEYLALNSMVKQEFCETRSVVLSLLSTPWGNSLSFAILPEIYLRSTNGFHNTQYVIFFEKCRIAISNL